MERRRPKGRKMGSSRRLMMKQEDAAAVEAEAPPENQEDSVFNEMTEKIQQLLSNDGANSNLFLTREDMEKISGAIFCTVEDLEELYDELNKGGKAHLTCEEFTSGLKNLIKSDGNQWNQRRKRKSMKRIPEFPRSLSLEEADMEERKQFKSFMEQLGAHNVFEDESEIWKLWTRLGHEEPHLMENLEEFLAKVINQIKEAMKEKETLEMMLKRRITEHNVEVQRLYEEMEQQMREEIKQLTNESNTRSSVHDQEMKNAIELKNTEVQQLISVQTELEKELYKLQSMEQVTKSENEKLKRTNQDLEVDLEKIRDQLSEAQGCLSEIKQEMAQREHEKEINEELMNISSAQFYQIFFQDDTKKAKSNEESEQGDSQDSIDLEQQNTFKNVNDFKSSRSRVISIEEDPIQECLLKHSQLLPEGITEEMPSEDFFGATVAGDAVPIPGRRSPAVGGNTVTEGSRISFHINKTSYRDVRKIDIASQARSSQQDCDFNGKDHFFHLHEEVEKENISAEGGSEKPINLEEFHADPDYVYKIMFVGNTHVGKTSFLHQVHDGSYHKNTSATIGIDYRIKSLIVDSKHYALQLWDTAGQERFYSITEQFFRKADAIVIMYDVTSRDTFIGVRRWLNCIREKVIDDIIILLLGNKIDCDVERQVTFDDGQKLAQEYKLLFSECSAASGRNITESLIQIARSLKEQENNMKKNLVTLRRSASLRKTSCCT